MEIINIYIKDSEARSVAGYLQLDRHVQCRARALLRGENRWPLIDVSGESVLRTRCCLTRNEVKEVVRVRVRRRLNECHDRDHDHAPSMMMLKRHWPEAGGVVVN
jgi:hypothetical protein